MGKTFKSPAIAALILTALILLCAGLFLFFRGSAGSTAGKQPANGTIPVSSDADDSVRYIHISKIINNKKQEINILEVNPSVSGVQIKPVLSHDYVYGYDYLSEIIKRTNAYAAINAGFFSEYGLPSGMVAIDGKVLTLPTGKYPVFYVSGGKASLGMYKVQLKLIARESEIRPEKFNMPAGKWECAVYTPAYGLTNRVKGENYTVAVKAGKVISSGFRQEETKMPADGILITIKTEGQGFDEAEKNKYSSLLSLVKGDTVELSAFEKLPEDLQAYECGSWIVKEGNIVIGEKDPWIGVTTNNDPRTAIGLKKDGTVVMMTVDGRQPGYSEGMSCEELGEFLLGYGVENAAMLDGGASTEMVVNGRLVNKPSFKGKERPIAGGIAVFTDKMK